MYAIHTTPGFIIESRPVGEASRLLYIFTRELGLVMASAQGVRLEKSKLRYHTQEFSLAEFSFVRGKEFWRMTNASRLSGDSDQLSVVSGEWSGGGRRWEGAGKLVPRIALILRRLLHGEEAHPELFDHIRESLDFIEKSAQGHLWSKEQAETLESVVIFRIMHLLGYIGADKGLDTDVIGGPISVGLLDRLVGQRAMLNTHINKALRESHL